MTEYRYDWKENALEQLEQQESEYGGLDAPNWTDDGWWPDDAEAPVSASAVCEAEIAQRLAESPNPEMDLAEPMHYRGIDVDEEALNDGPMNSVNTVELMELDLPQTRFVVEGLLPTGLNLLASPPKFGKSWMVLDLCFCVAAGKPFLGRPTKQADCLYLALEDSQARLQNRTRILLQDEAPNPAVHFYTEPVTLREGLLDKLEFELRRWPRTRLIVIDTLQKIRDGSRSGEGVYSRDYRELGAIKQFADHNRVCVLLVHHLNKSTLDGGDPHSRINGSSGILGAADTSLVLTKQSRLAEEATLAITGRDIETDELTLHFDAESCRWSRATAGSTVSMEDERLLLTIRNLVEEGGGQWKGSAKDLMIAVRGRTGHDLAATAQRLNNQLLPALESRLMQEHRIRHVRLSNGSGGSRHIFECSRS